MKQWDTTQQERKRFTQQGDGWISNALGFVKETRPQKMKDCINPFVYYSGNSATTGTESRLGLPGSWRWGDGKGA